MLKNYLIYELYTVLVVVLLSGFLSCFTSISQFISMLSGVLGYCIVFTVYYVSCLIFFEKDSAQTFVARTVFGFILKVVLTVSYFVYIHRHFSLDLRYAALAFVVAVVISSFIPFISAGYRKSGQGSLVIMDESVKRSDDSEK